MHGFFGHRLSGRRLSGSRVGALIVALSTLFGTAFVGMSSASALPLTWSATSNPFAAFIPASTGTPAPNLNTDSAGSLNGVSCADSHFCFAVGNSGSATGPSLTEAWDGHRWSAAPRSTVELSVLKGVSCTGRSFCAAVGLTNNTTSVTTLAEIWNGTSWSIPPTPNTAMRDNELDGVSCVSPTSCVAVGHSFDGTTFTTLVEHWNGMAWSVSASPNVALTSNTLAAVSCASPVDCIAVGAAGAGAPGSGLSLIERWNGSTWTIVSAPNVGALETVSCVFATWCLTGGATGIELFNGAAWAITPTPMPLPGHSSDFPAISCPRAFFCVAVDRTGGPTPGALSSSELTWTGTTWSPAPGALSVGGGLKGAGCASKRFCFVVGGSGIVDTSGPSAVVGRS